MKKNGLAAIRFSISFCAENLAINHLWRSVLLEIDSEQGPPLPSNISEPFAYDLATLRLWALVVKLHIFIQNLAFSIQR